MSRSRTVLIFDTDLPGETQADLLDTDASNGRTLLHKVRNFVMGLLAGARLAKVYFGSVEVSSTTTDAVAASLVGTFTDPPSNDDTCAINGVTFTAKTSGATGNQFNVGSDAEEAASNMAAAINASTSAAVVGVVKATASGATVTIECLIPGIIGNSITVADSLDNFTWAGAATSLTSGSGLLPILKNASFGK